MEGWTIFLDEIRSRTIEEVELERARIPHVSVVRSHLALHQTVQLLRRWFRWKALLAVLQPAVLLRTKYHHPWRI